MKAILLFHMRVGGRLALASFAPLFSAIIAWIMLQIDPAGTVALWAKDIFGTPPSASAYVILAALAFALPAWAAPRMAHGLNGWTRHLPISSSGNRRGLALALVIVQAPLAVGLGILGFVAHVEGVSVFGPTLTKLPLLLIGAAFAALPSKRHVPAALASASGALLALCGGIRMLLPAAGLIVAADLVSGPIRETREPRSWGAAGSFLGARIAWRALGWRLAAAYVVALIPLGVTELFVRNNGLTGGYLAGAARFGGSMASVLFLSALSERLSERRPVWPWARSLAWSSGRRIFADAAFLAAHASPLLLPLAFVNAPAAFAVLLLIPLLATRAAGQMRRMPERRVGGTAFVLEGFLVSGLAALLPWTPLLALASAPVAFHSARNMECRQKVTRWLERHHDSGGDPLSWSAQ